MIWREFAGLLGSERSPSFEGDLGLLVHALSRARGEAAPSAEPVRHKGPVIAQHLCQLPHRPDFRARRAPACASEKLSGLRRRVAVSQRLAVVLRQEGPNGAQVDPEQNRQRRLLLLPIRQDTGRARQSRVRLMPKTAGADCRGPQTTRRNRDHCAQEV